MSIHESAPEGTTRDAVEMMDAHDYGFLVRVCMRNAEPSSSVPSMSRTSERGSACVRFVPQIIDDLLDGGDLFRIFVWNVDLKFRFQQHDQLDHR
jgi:hypothetical protein